MIICFNDTVSRLWRSTKSCIMALRHFGSSPFIFFRIFCYFSTTIFNQCGCRFVWFHFCLIRTEDKISGITTAIKATKTINFYNFVENHSDFCSFLSYSLFYCTEHTILLSYIHYQYINFFLICCFALNEHHRAHFIIYVVQYVMCYFDNLSWFHFSSSCIFLSLSPYDSQFDNLRSFALRCWFYHHIVLYIIRVYIWIIWLSVNGYCYCMWRATCA